MHVSQTGHAQATPVPIYTETDEKGFSARLKTFQNSHPKYPIVPVTKHPGTPSQSHNRRRSAPSSTAHSWQSARSDARPLQADIVAALFAAIATRDTAAVHHLITQGLVSPDCPSATGETPLLASIRARSAPTARTLLALGADANLFGRASAAAEPGAAATSSSSSSSSDDDDDDDDDVADRTPLMLAAATGQLATVRVLVEEFAADDAVVGPRGETALWLAAGAGHRDVVRYLPARRGGAWRRLRHSREVAALRRAVKTVGKVVRILGRDIPLLLLVVLPWEAVKFVWKRRHRIWPWVVRVVKGIPGGMGDLAKCAWRGVRGLRRLAWRVFVLISEALPRALGIVWRGLVDGARRVGRAVGFAARRVLSVLHSFFAAVVARLRDIKLKDVGHDLLVALEALFVRLPRAVWAVMCQFGVVAGRAIRACFTGYCIRALFRFFGILPKALWSILQSLWASFRRGVDELITLVNPKRVSSGASRS